MNVTVRTLLNLEEARLTLVSGGAGLEAEVRWVHTSEVDDPTPWLEGGEFLLTTGPRLTTPASMVAYIERLHAHGVAGLGFGTGSGTLYRHVPEPIREASDRLAFPVLEVPYDVPFIMLTEFVSSHLAEERYQTTQSAYRAQQQLTQAALSEAALGDLVTKLAELTGGWAAVTTPSGEMLDASPGIESRDLDEIASDLTRVRESGTVVAVADAGGRFIAIHPLGATGRTRAMLVLGQETPPDVYERMIAASAASLFSFIIEQRMMLSPQRMAAANLLGDALLDPDTPRERMLRAAAGLGIDPAATLTLARLEVTGSTPASVAQVLHDVFSQHGGTSVTVRDREISDRYTLITDFSGPVFEELLGLQDRFEAQSVPIGVGTSVRLSELHLSYNQATLALSHARRRPASPVVRFSDLQHYDRIIGLASPPAVATFVATELAPLQRLERSGAGGGRRNVLIETLRVFLRHHGRWDPAARELGVHRQTLIKRMARIETLLEVDLDSPDTRMGLWFALSAYDVEHPALSAVELSLDSGRPGDR